MHIYEHVLQLVFMGKNANKKVAAFFKIDAEIDAMLREKAVKSGYTQTKIVEDALKEWFAGGLCRQLQAAAESVKCIRDKSDTDLVESMEVVMARRVGSKSEPKK